MKRAYSEVEPKVKPLVDKMNATGLIRTLASCQGHGILGKPPYVYFKAPVYIAASIERQLREAAMFDDPGLNTDWIIKGLFDADYELAFLLHSPEYHEKSFSLWAPLFIGLFRKRLDAELLFLAYLVEKAMLSNIRDIHKPYIATCGKHDDETKQNAKQG